MSFGNEGSGYSVRIPYDWSVNTTYQLTVKEQGSDSNGTAWGAYIVNTSNNVQNYVGEINAPSSWSGLSGSSSAWTELYSAQPTTCSGVPLSEVDFTNFTANNGSVTPSSNSNNLQNGSSCTNSYITNIPGGVEQVVGKNQPTPTPAPTPTPTPTPTPAPTSLSPAPSITTKTNTPTKVPSVASITITILSPENQPVANAKITLNGKSKETNSNGQVTFSSVRTGNYYVIVESSGKKQQFELAVKSSSIPQHIGFKLASASISLWPEISIGLVIFIVILVAFTHGIISKVRKQSKLNTHSVQQLIPHDNNLVEPNHVENRPLWQQEVLNNLKQNHNEQLSNQVVVNEQPSVTDNKQHVGSQQPVIHPASLSNDPSHSIKPN